MARTQVPGQANRGRPQGPWLPSLCAPVAERPRNMRRRIATVGTPGLDGWGADYPSASTYLAANRRMRPRSWELNPSRLLQSGVNRAITGGAPAAGHRPRLGRRSLEPHRPEVVDAAAVIPFSINLRQDFVSRRVGNAPCTRSPARSSHRCGSSRPPLRAGLFSRAQLVSADAVSHNRYLFCPRVLIQVTTVSLGLVSETRHVRVAALTRAVSASAPCSIYDVLSDGRSVAMGPEGHELTAGRDNSLVVEQRLSAASHSIAFESRRPRGC